jgi:hypothetical protein
MRTTEFLELSGSSVLTRRTRQEPVGCRVQGGSTGTRRRREKTGNCPGRFDPANLHVSSRREVSQEMGDSFPHLRYRLDLMALTDDEGSLLRVVDHSPQPHPQSTLGLPQWNAMRPIRAGNGPRWPFLLPREMESRPGCHTSVLLSCLLGASHAAITSRLERIW